MVNDPLDIHADENGVRKCNGSLLLMLVSKYTEGNAVIDGRIRIIPITIRPIIITVLLRF